MLRCPNDPEHDTFVMNAMIPETWILDKDGDCEYIKEQQGAHIEADLATARCSYCDALVEIYEDDTP